VADPRCPRRRRILSGPPAVGRARKCGGCGRHARAHPAAAGGRCRILSRRRSGTAGRRRVLRRMEEAEDPAPAGVEELLPAADGGRRPVELPTADRVATASQSFSREGARSWDVWAHADGVDGGLRENEGRSPDATAGQKCHPSPPGDGWCPRCGWSKSIPVSASFNPFRDIM
jgi:hypothetical protein